MSIKKEDELSLKPIPKDERVGWRAPLFNILGSNVAISELMVGGALIAGMSLQNLVVTSIVGNLLLVVILIIQGNIGTTEGLNTYVISESVFGKVGGRWLISGLLGITSFGWFGIQAGVAGLSLLRIFPNLNLTVSVIVLGILMMLFAVLGFEAIAKFNYIAVPPLIILMIWGLYKAVTTSGVDKILNYVPTDQITLVDGLNMVIGLIIVGAVISPDQLRYTRNVKDVAIIGLIGFALISVFQQVAAGVLAMGSPSWDITEVLADLGFNEIAFIILLLAAWSTNVTNAYSGGLALKTLFPDVSRDRLTLIAGSIGTIIAATGIIFKFQGFLSLLSMTVASIAGVIWVDYYILNGRRLRKREGINWSAIVSWIIGFVTSYITTKASFFIPPINGIVVAGVVYYILKKVVDKDDEFVELEF